MDLRGSLHGPSVDLTALTRHRLIEGRGEGEGVEGKMMRGKERGREGR